MTQGKEIWIVTPESTEAEEISGERSSLDLVSRCISKSNFIQFCKGAKSKFNTALAMINLSLSFSEFPLIL